MRPDVGTQAQFKKRKPPVTYRYDSSLSPALDWDGQNPAREQGEQAIAEIEAATAALAAAVEDAGTKSGLTPPARLAQIAELQARIADAAERLKRSASVRVGASSQLLQLNPRQDGHRGLAFGYLTYSTSAFLPFVYVLPCVAMGRQCDPG